MKRLRNQDPGVKGDSATAHRRTRTSWGSPNHFVLFITFLRFPYRTMPKLAIQQGIPQFFLGTILATVLSG